MSIDIIYSPYLILQLPKRLSSYWCHGGAPTWFREAAAFSFEAGGGHEGGKDRGGTKRVGARSGEYLSTAGCWCCRPLLRRRYRLH
jgi:hypothetical protein